MRYTCSYTDGDETEYQDGIWERRQTPKTITLTKVSEYMGGIYSNHEIGFKAKVGLNTGNPLKEWGDDTFTVYFGQAGTPYYFEPIE